MILKVPRASKPARTTTHSDSHYPHPSEVHFAAASRAYADLRDTGTILARAADTLDFGRPVGIMLLGIVNFVPDDDEAGHIVTALLDAVPSGSYLTMSHPTREVSADAVERALELWNSSGAAPMALRSPAQLEGYFGRLDLLEPGVVTVSRWRPDGNDTTPCSEFGGVARKP